MFYSEQLLSKTGPLARVWLASNVERKLSKSQILQSDINTSVDVIVDQGQAPMALRLSGQLMLGVVRIYGRKARYLLDDCNEALLRIRMTFKPTNNHDLPAHANTSIDINLPEMLTIDDLFPTMDFGFTLTQPPTMAVDDDIDGMEEDWTSSLAPQQATQSFLTPKDAIVGGDDLGIDFGDDVGMEDTTISMQLGREAPTPKADAPFDGPAIYDDGDDLGIDYGDDVPMPEAPTSEGQAQLLQEVEGLTAAEAPQQSEQQLEQRPEQEDETRLSDAGSEYVRHADETVAEQEVVAAQRQRSRKHKPLVADKETTLHNSEIKANAADRSKILRPASLMPRDPVLLALLSMQKNGEFVTNAMNDGRSRDWAPELQGLLSFEVVHRSGQRKRKRDSGIADLSEDEHSDKSPRLDRPDEEDQEALVDEGVALGPESPVDHTEAQGLGNEDDGFVPGDGAFDDTTMPLVHPADSGPISLGTKRAVHLLRDTFGGQDAENMPSTQSKKSVYLQDLVPEATTTREDATKMFFEILVLATKDAIKVDQSEKQPGLPLRIRAKRGLWGQWAEATPSDNAEVEAQA